MIGISIGVETHKLLATDLTDPGGLSRADRRVEQMKNLKLSASSSGNYDDISLVHGDAGNYLQVVRCFAYSLRSLSGHS